MRIVCLTVGNRQAGSSRFRLFQYEPEFAQQGYHLDWIEQKELSSQHLDLMARADLVINQKCLLPSGLSKAIRRVSKRVIFDFDDAVYTRHGKPYSWITQRRVNRRLHYWLTKSDQVLAANRHLASYAEKLRSPALVLPMSLDLSAWTPSPQKTQRTVIGWAGAPHNLRYLEALEPALSQLLNKHPHVQLAVFSGQRPSLTCPYQYTPFDLEQEIPFVQNLSIGLLPLDNDPFTLGKSPIKAIQYLACGVPVVGNIYGATADILNSENSLPVRNLDEWTTTLEQLLANPSQAAEMGRAGRAHAQTHHDRKKVAQRLCETFQRTANA